jgi:hypothetical protein
MADPGQIFVAPIDEQSGSSSAVQVSAPDAPDRECIRRGHRLRAVRVVRYRTSPVSRHCSALNKGVRWRANGPPALERPMGRDTIHDV